MPRQPTVSSGVPGFDAILGGGLPAGHLYLIEGHPGAGKTTLALQFLIAARDRGERVLYCTLSESETEINKIAESHGWTLEGVTILEMGPEADAASQEDAYTVFRPSDIELGATTRRMLEAVDELQPAVVVVDSLSELRLVAQDPLRYRRKILALKHFFSRKSCTVLLLDDRTVQAGDLQPKSIAHGVIELDRLPTEYGAERRRIRVVKLRGTPFSGGFHDFSIRTGGLAVFPRISEANSEHEFGDEPVTTGIPGFDVMLGGGLDRGTSTLLTGPAGTGKSTLALAVLDAAARRGERSAVFGFEENRRIMQRRAGALGMDLERHIASGIIGFRSVLPAEMSPGEFATHVREAVERDGVRIVMIDSLNGYLNSMPEERFLAPQMHELLGYLNNRGVVTILVLAQRGMMGSGMHAAVDVSYLADTVVMLRLFEAFGSIRKAVSVLKKRTGRHEDTIRELRFDGAGVHVGKPLTDFRGVLSGVPEYTGTEQKLDRGTAHDAP